MHDTAILKSFLNKDEYFKYRSYIKKNDLVVEIDKVLTVLDDHYTKGGESITEQDLANLYFSKHPVDDFYRLLFDQLKNTPVLETTTTLLEGFKTRRICQDISLLAMEVVEGRKDVKDLLKLSEKLGQPLQNETKIEVVTDDIEEILRDTVQQSGLRWRLQSLNRSLGSLRRGDFGFIFARPETGKTTFLASEVTYMSGQATGPVLWWNNEEQGKKVKLRCYQAALGWTLPQLLSDRGEAKKAYEKATGGNLVLLDASKIHYREIEKACEEYKPSLIIFDQIDKITGFTDDREDLRMGKLYQWARELAKDYAPVIAVCQADGSGEGEKWLTMANVANAKTAKQAEADWIVGIGKTHDIGFDNVRYLNISKNKLAGDQDTDQSLRHAKIEAIIQPTVARYNDFQSE